QLHLHPHGERFGAGDGAGARIEPRRRAAARVRLRRADARHRQGQHAARGAEQAGQADQRGVRHHEAPRRRRGAYPEANARDAGARADCGLRAPLEAGSLRLPGEHRQPQAESLHHDRVDCRRVRRAAEQPPLSRGDGDRAHPQHHGRAGQPRLQPGAAEAVRQPDGPLPHRHAGAAEHRRNRRGDRRAPDRSVPAAGQDHHRQVGRDRRGTAARQHLGSRRTRRAAIRRGRSGRSRIDRYRPAELPMSDPVSQAAKAVDRPAPTEAPAPLGAAETAKLTDFARACKAAARAVVLYPTGHPAITATLGRIAHITSSTSMTAPLRITVLPDGLLLEERQPARPDAAIGELAVLLHSHLIGEITVLPGGDAEAWRTFLLLLGRAPDSVRADGGIARVWTTMAFRHVELREIDYAEVLRERKGGESAVWDKVIANCLQGSAFELDEEGIRELLGIAADSERLAEMMASLEAGGDASGGIAPKAAALMRMLRGIVDAVSKTDPDRLEPVLRNMASAVGQCSPDMLLGLMGQRDDEEGPRLVQAVVSRMTDTTIARFVARHVISESAPTDRLALAFQTLVREPDQQQRVLSLAHDDVAASPLGSTEGFESVWNHVAEKLLTSYSDEPFVSDAYGRELSGARTQAIEVEQVNDDPPDRVGAWKGTIATTALRALDLTLVLDLLRIEQDEERWGDLMKPVVQLLEDLLLVGDFDAANQLVAVLVREAGAAASG